MIFKTKSNYINDLSPHYELSICIRSTRHPTDVSKPVNVSISRIECFNISNSSDEEILNIIVDMGFSCSTDANITLDNNDNFTWRQLTESSKDISHHNLIQSNEENIENTQTDEEDISKDNIRVFTFRDEDPKYSFSILATDLNRGNMLIGIRNASDNNNLLSTSELNISELLNQLK